MKILDLNEQVILTLFNKVKKMSYRQFYDVIQKYGEESYNMGLETGTVWTDIEIFDLLCSEGIEVEQAVRIVEKLVWGEKNG